MNPERECNILTGQFIDLVNKAGADGVIVGLSGGIDSAVVAALAVRALGNARVYSVYMPCYPNPDVIYSPHENEDRRDAGLLAERLDISFDVLNLGATFQVLCTNINQTTFYSCTDRLAKGNMMARLRMTALYAMKESLNCLCVGTGNLTEIMLGYLTKYGDGGVDFEPIGAYYKTEVYELARHLEIDLLSPNIMNKAPSARLWDDQTDEGDLGYTYEEIDKCLRIILDGGGYATAKCVGIDKNLFNKIDKMIAASEHKRNIPPVFVRAE